MSTEPTPAPIERLLAEREWLRRLARALVRDPATAEDLTQETYVTALQVKPGTVRRPRAWLATVLRNRLRNRRRDEVLRRTREGEARSRAASPSPADALARAELVERIGRLVLDLPEPYRSTIVLRFFEDLPPRLVAERQSVPVETVRTRTRRALAILQKQLDDLHDGHRGPWVAALLPWAEAGRVASVAAIAPPVLKAGALALAVLLLGALAWVVRDRLAPTGTSTEDAAEEHAERSAEEVAGPTLTGRGAEAHDASVPAEAVRVVGRVVDAARRPVVGAGVVAAGAETASNGTGHFVLDVEAPIATVAVVARGSDGAVAATTLRVPADTPTVDAGVLVLEEGHGLDVLVRNSEGDPLRAHVLAWPLVPPGVAPIRERDTDDRGRVALTDLPRGAYRIFAVAAGLGRAEARVWVPRLVDGPCVLELEPPRDVTLRVLDSRTGEPVEGATVLLFDSPDGVVTVPRTPRVVVAPTDANGETVVHGIGRDETPRILVQGGGIAKIRAKDGRWLFMLGTLPPQVVTHEWKVYRPTAVRWRVLPGEVECPPDGAILQVLGTHDLEPFACPPARIEDGHVVADETADGRFVVSDDGRIARLARVYGTDREPTTAFRRARSITVVAREEDGQPVAGAGFRPIGGNDNPLAPIAWTDAEGVARLEGFHGGVVELWRVGPRGDRRIDPRGVMELDLEAGDTRVEVTCPNEVAVRVRIRTRGEPRLPPSYHLTLTGAPVVDIEEDPETATLRFTWRPLHHVPQILHLTTAASLTGVATLPPGEGDVEVAIDLQPAGVFFAHIVPPPDGRPQAVLQYYGGKQWRDAAHIHPAGADLPPDGHVRFGPVAPGRYRVVDRESRVASEPVEVTARGQPPTTTLDLRDLMTVRGRVEVPEGRSFEDVRVLVLPSGHSHEAYEPEHRAPVSKDGRFRVRVPASQGTTLRVEHPILRPDPEQGSYVVEGPASDVVLALVTASEILVRLDPTFDIDSRPRVLPHAYLYRGEAKGEPTTRLDVTIEKNVVRIARPLPGTWTLWLDIGVDLPLVWHDLELGPGITDLGRIALRRGSVLKVRVQMPEGHATPFLGIFVKRQEAPQYSRYLLFQQREKELELPGLLPGTWKLDVLHPEADRLPKEVTVGEEEVVDVVLDFR